MPVRTRHLLRSRLRWDGHVVHDGPFASTQEAFDAAHSLMPGDDLEVLGTFVLPPADGAPSRDFQTLHIDFGLPLEPRGPADVGRYTALHIPVGAGAPVAATRLVALDGLAASAGGVAQWPARVERYGRLHGGRAGSPGYVEGSLARLMEAVLGGAPALPSVRADPAFLCGAEFASLQAERAFFERLGVRLQEWEVRLRPGQLLVFDNLAVAHGRRGVRRPGELRQQVLGHRGLDAVGQRRLRDEVFARLAGRDGERHPG
ncbi:MAG TPA: hypothetical protein VD931_00745 [Baekduia sp.]|nr:hypothetical protein [Baekduia sp.]